MQLCTCISSGWSATLAAPASGQSRLVRLWYLSISLSYLQGQDNVYHAEHNTSRYLSMMTL